MRNHFIITFLFILGFQVCDAQEYANHKQVLLLMGTRFEITAIGETEEQALRAVEAGIKEIERIELLISSWKKESQTSEINRNAGIKPVKVDAELFELIFRANKISTLTHGAFDISFAGMGKLYQFDKQESELPEPEVLSKLIDQVDYSHIYMDRENSTVYLERKGMRIGFGAIGKGYAANKAKEIMSKQPGIVGGLVNAAGDLLAWGENGKDKGWPIQIANPSNINESLGWLNINNQSVVTSGDYEKYFSHDGKRYSHIIDPKTGIPTTGIKSATVICPDAEAADAIATALFVLGPKNGIAMINNLKNFEALIITDEDKILTSENLQLNKIQ